MEEFIDVPSLCERKFNHLLLAHKRLDQLNKSCLNSNIELRCLIPKIKYVTHLPKRQFW